MSKRPFDKELFKRSVVYNVKTLYRTPIEEATQHQIFHAVALATRTRSSTHGLQPRSR